MVKRHCPHQGGDVRMSACCAAARQGPKDGGISYRHVPVAERQADTPMQTRDDMEFGMQFFSDGKPDAKSARQYFDEALCLVDWCDEYG